MKILNKSDYKQEIIDAINSRQPYLGINEPTTLIDGFFSQPLQLEQIKYFLENLECEINRNIKKEVKYFHLDYPWLYIYFNDGMKDKINIWVYIYFNDGMKDKFNIYNSIQEIKTKYFYKWRYCASCGKEVHISKFDYKNRCEISLKNFWEKVRKVYWYRYSKNK